MTSLGQVNDLRRLLVSASVASLAVSIHSTAAYAAAPTVVIASSPGIDPASALTYFGSPVSPAAAATRDPIIQEIARSLNYDVDQIFEYTRDNIEFLPMFGLLKGGRGVAIDSYGTAFDQAQFMVDALRESDAVAGKGYAPNYVLGRITLSNTQFASWTGISDAALATKYLASGGIPATVTGTGPTFTVAMMHIWVSANIGGTIYLFDPSQKGATTQAGLSWQNNTGYSKTALLAAGGGTPAPTASTIATFNSAAFRSALDGYRTNLENYINTNAAGKRAEAVVGTTKIVPHPVSENRRTTLPYMASSDRTWAGEVPDAFRTAFTVSLNGSAYGTYYADTVGSKVLGFGYSGSGTTFAKGGELPAPVLATLALDQCDDYLGNRSAAGPATVSVAINHPYAASSGAYGDRVISRGIARQQCSSGRFFVSNDWGYVSGGTASRLSPVASALRTDPVHANEFVFAPTLANVASQYSALLDLSGKAQGNVFQLHDLVGIHTVDNVRTKLCPGCFFDVSTYLSMSFEGAVSAYSKANTAAGNISAAYMAGLGLAIVEGSVPRQEADAVYDMAALNLITQQNTRTNPAGTYPTYFATTNAWNSTKNSLIGYPATAVTALTTYKTEGYSLLIPQRGALRQPPITVASTATRTASLWEGFNTFGDGGELNRSAFIAIHPSGAAGSTPDKIAVGIYDQRRGSVVKAGLGIAMASGANNDPIRKPEAPKAEGKDFIRAALNVDGRTGAVTYAPSTDLADGLGEFPRSLELKRIYDSRDKSNYGFGVGWKSNWYQTVTYSNDGQAALGRGGAAGVASALVMLQAMGDLVQTQDARGLYPAAEVAAWFADTTINNTAVVNRGLDNEATFYRRAGGGYFSGRPDGGTLTVTGSPETGIVNRRLYRLMSASYTDAAGSVRSYSSAGDGVGYDLSSPALSALFARKTQYMKTWNFLNGLKVNAEYDSSFAASDVIFLQRVYNNLGNAIYKSFYDYGTATEEPVCLTPGGFITYNPPRPAEIRYRSSTTEVKYAMDAQVGWTLVGDPDTTIRCAPNSTAAPKSRQSYMSGLNGFSDGGGASWNYGYTPVATMFGTITGLGAIYKPTSATPDVGLFYGLDGNARAIVNLRNNSWIYRSSPFRAEVRTPLQETSGGPGGVTWFDRNAQPVRAIDPLLRTTATVYDDLGRTIEVTRPEGDKTLTGYDVRGNVLSETLRAKPGSGLADLTTTTTYATGATSLTCGNFAICNKPVSVVNPRNFRTNYTWDSVTGEPLSIATGFDAATGLTCQIAGGICPLTTFGYTALASYDPFAGASSGSLTLLTGKIVAIASGNSTATAYNYLVRDYSPAQYTGMSINPVKKVEVNAIVVDSGNLNQRSCFAYDKSGNVVSVTEPNAGLPTCP